MHGYVLDDNTVRLTFDDGTSVGGSTAPGPTIPAGTYTVFVNDDSELDNIHLTGPGVDYSTGVVENGTPTWTVTFAPGASYKFQSDSHPNVGGYYGYFQTSGSTASGASSSGSSSSTSGATSGSSSSTTSGGSGGTSSSAGSGKSTSAGLAGTLQGTIGPTGKARLLIGGKAVSKLATGRYKITIVDKSPRRGFVIREIGHSAITLSGIGFVGTRAVTANLAVGRWILASSGPNPSTASFSVTG